MKSTIERIAQRINELEMKDKDFCEAVGISQSTYATWKQRGTEPKAKYIEDIANVLETTSEYLLGWTDDPYDYESDPDDRLAECYGDVWQGILKKNNYDLESSFHEWVTFQEELDEDCLREQAYTQQSRRKLRSVARLEDADVTEEEDQEIENFISYLLEKRKKQK